jgi:hypothetical protein
MTQARAAGGGGGGRTESPWRLMFMSLMRRFPCPVSSSVPWGLSAGQSRIPSVARRD